MLYIRADANARIGTGHVMRCIALGQEWQRSGGTVTFLGSIDSPNLQERIRLEGFSLVGMPAVASDSQDAAFVDEVSSRAYTNGRNWLVLDGYHFNTPYQCELYGGKRKLLVIDDNALLSEYHCDILVNQNLHAEKLAYRGKAGMIRLLGPRYALLRSEFRQASSAGREIHQTARKVLITMGGADQANTTELLIAALDRLHIPDLQVRVVIGAENAHRESLHSLVKTLRLQCSLLPPTNNMFQLMQWPDAAITAAGSTTYELAACGVPFITVATADNQRNNAAELETQGISTNLGYIKNLTPDYLSSLLRGFLDDYEKQASHSLAGKIRVDGKGAERVVSVMRFIEFSLRPAEWSDRDLLLQWANDPQTRKNSFDSNLIVQEEHERWLAAKLKNADCDTIIAEDDKAVPIGVVRFDTTGERAIVSVNLAPVARGKGLGCRIIAAACDSLFRRRPITLIEAFIKASNTPSLQAFKRAGFTGTGVNGEKVQAEVCALHLSRSEWEHA